MRLFLSSWIVFSLFAAIFVAREHYPALALIERGNFQVDDYAGYHWDIFKHRDGHYYIGNQVTGSVIATPPLWLAKPLLAKIEAWEKEHPFAPLDQSTEYKLREGFRERARRDGRLLKLSAATAITTVFLTAPLSALFVCFFARELRHRGVDRRRAALMALLFGFGTPLLYRTAWLNHNLFLMWSSYLAFYFVRPDAADTYAPSFRRRATAGFFGGLCVALDYAGVVPLLAMFLFLIVKRRSASSFAVAVKESLVYVLGSIPPVVFLCWSQWWTFGHPFLPGQHWMPQDQNNLVQHGWHGFDWPRPSVLWECLASLDYGLFTFGPIFLGLILAVGRSKDSLLFPGERRLIYSFVIALLLFCAANTFSILQANTGFRYLLPIVPFLFWPIADVLSRSKEWVVWVIGLPTVVHSFVLSMYRFTPVTDGDTRTAVGESWRRFLDKGITYPWLNVLREALGERKTWLSSPILPIAVTLLVAAMVFAVARIGARRRAT